MITWTEIYSVNSPEMDAQHQKLFSLVSHLYNAMMQGSGKTVLDQTLDELVVYTKSHFRAEESMMAQIGYPKLAEHRRLHLELTGQVLEFQRDLRAGRNTITVQLLQFLREWLVNHILKVDKEYARFAEERTKTGPVVAAV